MARNLAEIIPAVITGPGGVMLTPEQIAQRQALAQSLIGRATDTRPDAGGWASVINKALMGGLAGYDMRQADLAETANDDWNRSEASAIGALLAGGDSPVAASAATSGVNQELGATAPGASSGTAAPVVAEGEIADYIRQSAIARGIDPDVALRVAMSEGGLKDPVRQSEVVKNGVREQSYGPFQLYMGGGLGNKALEAGIDPRDPNQWKQGVDFALDQAAKGGWSPWYGAAKVGIGNRTGLERARPIGFGRTAAQATPAPVEVASTGYVDPVVSAPNSAATPVASLLAENTTQAAPPLPEPVNVASAPAVASVPAAAPAAPTAAPTAPSASREAITRALQVMNDPRATPGTRAVAQALLQREQGRQQQIAEQQQWIARQEYERQMRDADPLRQLQIQKAQQDLAGGSRQALINAGDGRLYDPNTQSWIQAPNSGQAKAPETQTFYDEQGREYRAQWNPESASWERVGGSKLPSGMTIRTNPDGSFELIQGQGAGGNLTEAQSKDAVYSTRARGALTTLDKFDTQLTSLPQRAAEYDPTGLARSAQSPEFQQAKNAGDEFLQAILRKDTGAAITKEEMESYGRTYLPMPGDGPELLSQKRVARARALAALEAGMPAQAILNQEKALERSSQSNSNADDIARAREAIAKGANRDAVIKRLQDAGISTEGL